MQGMRCFVKPVFQQKFFILNNKCVEYIIYMKKVNFFVFCKKHLIFCISTILLIALIFASNHIIKLSSPKAQYTVVIDAGHGGIDGGSVGINSGTTEAELNLQYALTLQKYLSDFGFDVIMTRTSSGGLYNPFASNKKRDDMQKRKAIIENANADFVISIHMNSFKGDANGAQVFYGNNDAPSKLLASNIQKYFIKYLHDAKSSPAIGDYYVLNAIKCPSVLVECGYLSNAQEETLLLSEDYKKEVCYCILLGILEYFV